MPTEILMPALSPTMEEGKLAKWLVKRARRSRPATSSPRSRPTRPPWRWRRSTRARLAKILVPAGTENVKVNTPIALIAGEDERQQAANRESRLTLPGHGGAMPRMAESRPTRRVRGEPSP